MEDQEIQDFIHRWKDVTKKEWFLCNCWGHFLTNVCKVDYPVHVMSYPRWIKDTMEYFEFFTPKQMVLFFDLPLYHSPLRTYVRYGDATEFTYLEEAIAYCKDDYRYPNVRWFVFGNSYAFWIYDRHSNDPSQTRHVFLSDAHKHLADFPFLEDLEQDKPVSLGFRKRILPTNEANENKRRNGE